MKHSQITPDYTALKNLGLPGWTRSLPSADISEHRQKPFRTQIGILIALNAVSIAVALLLLGGVVLSWSSNAELNTLRKELEGLTQFEERILARVDAMNNGVQHRLSKIDRRMGAIQSEFGLVTTGHRDPATTVENIATMVRNDGGYFGTATAELLLSPEASPSNAQRFVPSGSMPGLSFAKAGAPEEEASLFRRVTTEDGKVRYEIKR